MTGPRHYITERIRVEQAYARGLTPEQVALTERVDLKYALRVKRDMDKANDIGDLVEHVAAGRGHGHRDDVCRKGHPRTDENTRIRPDGIRECQDCRAASRRRQQAAS